MNQEPRDRELEDAYRDAATDTPSPELDARILAAAHRAVGAHPKPASPRPGWFERYRIPLSIAATALIAVAVALMVEDESQRTPAPDAPLSSPAPRSVPAAPPAAAIQKVPMNEAERRKESSGVPAMPAPAPRMDAPPAGATPAPAPKPMESRERSLGDRPGREAREAAPQSRAMSRPAPAAAPAPQRSVDEWIADIRRLRAEDRHAEADAALETLLQQYPGYTLPEDLRR